MLPAGMSMLNVMSSPDIVPENEPDIMPCIPEKVIEPVTVDPLWVSCHVIVPMPVWPIMLPAPIAVLESDALPAHVPAMDTGADGAIGELPPHAPARHVNRTAANCFFTL